MCWSVNLIIHGRTGDTTGRFENAEQSKAGDTIVSVLHDSPFKKEQEYAAEIAGTFLRKYGLSSE